MPRRRRAGRGGYGGVSLGYSFGADDVIGQHYLRNGDTLGRRTGLDNVRLEGATVDLHAYRWERGDWVFGPELAIEGGAVDNTRDYVAPAQGLGPDTDYMLESKVNWIATLAFKTGYRVNPQTLLYGTAGVNHGDFDYTLSLDSGSETVGYTQNGGMPGLGLERKLSDRVSMVAEYQYRQFGKTDNHYPGESESLRTEATPEHQNIKLGVNFRF